ncbi:MAG: hypothetical protein N2035_01745 [Chthoniobacterales bacterium]|nr:hypothetical protein [Chthoniobacterales bacterium]
MGCVYTGTGNLTPPEKAILDFHLEGIALGSSPSKLSRFSQVQAIAENPADKSLYIVFNPNPNISSAIFSYVKNSLKSVEMRYYEAVGMDSLTKSGGWDGILRYLEGKYGPASEVGPQVVNVATMPGLDPNVAVFNGEWNFTRVHRQMNYIAQQSPTGWFAAIVIQETEPPPAAPKKKETKKKKEQPAQEQKEHPAPYPGF